MRSTLGLSIGLFMLSVSAQNDDGTLTSAVKALPSCSNDSFADAMASNDCDPSDTFDPFGCMCDIPLYAESSPVQDAVQSDVSTACFEDFYPKFYNICHIYYDVDITQDDLDSATNALSSAIDGANGASTSASPTSMTRTRFHLTGTPSTTISYYSEAETTSEAPAISTTSESTPTSEALTTNSATRTVQITVTAGASTTSNGAFAAAPTKIGNLVGPVIAAIAVLL